MPSVLFVLYHIVREFLKGLSDSFNLRKLREDYQSARGEKAERLSTFMAQLKKFFAILIFSVLFINLLPIAEAHVSSYLASIPPEEFGLGAWALYVELWLLFALRLVFFLVMFLSTKLIVLFHFSKITSDFFYTPIASGASSSYFDGLSNFVDTFVITFIPFIFSICAGFLPYVGLYISFIFNILYYCIVAIVPRTANLSVNQKCDLIERSWPYFLGFTLIASAIASLPIPTLVLCVSGFLDIWMTAAGTKISTSIRVNPPVRIDMYSVAKIVTDRIINSIGSFK